LHIQDAEKNDKNVVFIPNEDKDMVVENNAFFDPHFSMLGFVMRGPRVTQKRYFMGFNVFTIERE